MYFMNRRIYLSLITMLFAVVSIAQTKSDADELYKKEKYTEAVTAYETLLKSEEGVSAALYYNLGNAYYKLDNIPLAILNYERALLLEPGDGDIRANLALARGKTIDKVTPPSEMFFVTWWHNLCNMMSIYTWCVTAVISFALMLLGILAYLFLSNITLRKIGVYGAMGLFLLFVVANISAYTQNAAFANRNAAIIISPAVSVKSSPTGTSTDLFVIHEGSKVEILDSSMKDWKEVKFEEGKQGWIPTSAIEVI